MTTLAWRSGIRILRCRWRSVHICEKKSLPIREHFWKTVPRPGGHRHISLEEYSAFCWALESRIHYADEVGSRCIHLADNASQIGAHCKGRSSCKRLNYYCRKDAALQLAADIDVFTIYEASKSNPADAPSSVYGVRAGRQSVPSCAATPQYTGGIATLRPEPPQRAMLCEEPSASP